MDHLDQSGPELATRPMWTKLTELDQMEGNGLKWIKLARLEWMA